VPLHCHMTDFLLVWLPLLYSAISISLPSYLVLEAAAILARGTDEVVFIILALLIANLSECHFIGIHALSIFGARVAFIAILY